MDNAPFCCLLEELRLRMLWVSASAPTEPTGSMVPSKPEMAPFPQKVKLIQKKEPIWCFGILFLLCSLGFANGFCMGLTG